MWSTTERREIRNFPYASVFELAGRQRLTVKRGIRNVGQLRPAVEGRKRMWVKLSVPRYLALVEEIVVRTIRLKGEGRREAK